MSLLSETLRQEDYIQEGVSPSPDVLLLACTVGDDYDNLKNRILVMRDGRWVEFGSSGDAVVSIDATASGSAYVLGENGSVIEFNWRTPLTQADLKATRKLLINSMVEPLGPLRIVRILGDDVLCAGSRGQVYVLSQGRFEALPRLIVDGEDGIIEDISGTSAKDFIAVTLEGYAASFNGSMWLRIDFPSNVCLASICVLNNGQYAIVGNKSALLIGRGDRWEVIAPIDQERNYYGVATINTKVYVAYLSGIDVFDGRQIVSFPLPENPPLEFAKLRSGPEGIWACAGHTVGVITASGWRAL